MSIPGGQVSFTYEWDRLDENDEEVCTMLNATATISTYHPAVMYLRNGDPGYPAEGGEVEDMEVSLPDGTKLDPIPDELYETLCNQAREEDIG